MPTQPAPHHLGGRDTQATQRRTTHVEPESEKPHLTGEAGPVRRLKCVALPNLDRPSTRDFWNTGGAVAGVPNQHTTLSAKGAVTGPSRQTRALHQGTRNGLARSARFDLPTFGAQHRTERESVSRGVEPDGCNPEGFRQRSRCTRENGQPGPGCRLRVGNAGNTLSEKAGVGAGVGASADPGNIRCQAKVAYRAERSGPCPSTPDGGQGKGLLAARETTLRGTFHTERQLSGLA